MSNHNISLLTLLLALLLASCNRVDSHIALPQQPDQTQGGVIVGFDDREVTNKRYRDTHLYAFDANRNMILHRYYPTQQVLSSDLFTMESGAYTFVAVLNVGQAFEPAGATPKPTDKEPSPTDAPLYDSSLNQLLNYVKQVENDYPDMLTGMINRSVTTDQVVRIEIPLSDRSGGLNLTDVTLRISLPDAQFADYQNARTRATAPHNLRGVVEFYRKGTNERIQHDSQPLTPEGTPGHYSLRTTLPSGNYDALLWVDYSEAGSSTDLWYHTPNLQTIKLIATDKSYTSGTDTRETFYGSTAVEASSKSVSVQIATLRPQAKYLLITDDIRRYRELMVANPHKYVPLEELSIAILYESYLPDGFNVKEGKPNSSQLGYKCNKVALPAVGASDTEARIGSDYVFVNGGESSVTVTVLVSDQTGRIISRVQGVTIQYKRNLLTTLRGDFLTAGIVNPGININTDWDGIHEVLF